MKFKRNLSVAVFGSVFIVALIGVSVHSYWRSRLPAVSEQDGIVLCRMRYCDFRFPLPPGAHIVSVSSLSVGSDTVRGTIVHSSATGAVTYDEVLRKQGFQFSPGSLLDTSSEQLGGWVQPGSGGRIDFSYFGDR